MSRDPHPAEAGGVPRPRRRARIAGPWYHSPKAALSGLAVLIAWGLLLPGATPVGGGMSTLGSLSLFGYGGFMTTLEVGIIATLCAFWLGVFLTLVRFFENKVMTGFVKVYVDVFRALPTIVLVSLIHYGAPFIGIYLPLMVSGILTLTLNHSAFFSEILRSGVSAVGHGQLEAARSLGLGTFKTFRLIVFPQAFKETVICSVVGIPELLREALVVQSWTANPTPLIIATIGYLLLLVPLTRLSRYLEVRMSTVRQAC